MKKIREQIAARRKEHNAEVSGKQAKHVTGRWVTDENALRRSDVRHKEKHMRQVPRQKARAEVMQVESSATGLELDVGEVSDRISQRDIVQSVDQQTAEKQFSLNLDKLGPYTMDFSRNGQHLALCGLRGHLSMMRWQKFQLHGEAQLKDKCTDIRFLVDHTMLAVAQKKFCYMYTNEGVEMHVLPSFANMDRLEYLHRHMLLVGASSQYSVLQWLDVSTGKNVAGKEPSVVRNPVCCLKQNPTNGVAVTADARGIIKFWAPNVNDALVQLKAHKGAVRDLCVHPNGRFVLSVGVDSKMKVWDVRTLRPLDEYAVNYNFDTMDISSTGLVALGGGTSIQLWKDLFATSRPRGPHMKHSLGYGNIACKVQFCPFEDVLGIGHSQGFQTMIVPGSGEANPDFFEANPYETDTHRKERVVGGLLDKLPSDTISMDLQIANVDEEALEKYNENLQANRKARMIREKKGRVKTEVSTEDTPHGLPGRMGDSEIAEELDIQEKGVSKQWKSKAELEKERKMKAWDKKDSSDKVRSKQKMRTSKVAQKERWRATQQRILGEEGGTAAKERTKRSRSGEDTQVRALRKSIDTSSNAALQSLRQ